MNGSQKEENGRFGWVRNFAEGLLGFKYPGTLTVEEPCKKYKKKQVFVYKEVNGSTMADENICNKCKRKEKRKEKRREKRKQKQ